MATLQQIFPKAKATTLTVLNNKVVLTAYNINTKLRKAALFAQLAHETGGFQWMHELGNNSYFTKYEGRMGNGVGEGAKYKGRGFIQLTGKNNYKAYGKRLGIDLLNAPALAEDPNIALQIACMYWNDHKLNHYADKEDIKAITKAINGGYNGLDDRIKLYKRFKQYYGI